MESESGSSELGASQLACGEEPPFRLCGVFEESGRKAPKPVAENRESQSLHDPSCIQIACLADRFLV
ncbi:hypothetical protein CKAN_01074200 [Cinnamomum micranthum f. kanehirae]|uniref:Uncharacterized protein n=1 Tax=Cinnamomum micranthum f. kanehirae TaxID=337451 RepID=A0A3S3Q9T9_9MAGN|nr:hypothetical protein CKAN_01074200 [Cinnamomum micranthum f. kanehirae]